jgi:hypothetical protein
MTRKNKMKRNGGLSYYNNRSLEDPIMQPLVSETSNSRVHIESADWKSEKHEHLIIHHGGI